MKELIKEIIISYQNKFPYPLLERSIKLPVDSGKIVALSGVRRSGKSSLLFLCINGLLQSGITKERILFLSFDDERLNFKTSDFDLIIQAYEELYPNNDLQNSYFFFDEVQINQNWEKFIRRIYDQHSKNIFITGPNSKMLSTDIATSLRGRTLQYEISTLSFREFLLFRNTDTNFYDSKNKAKIIASFYNYIDYGGFPEIALLDHEFYEKILQEYFYVMIYKDLIERYEYSNTTAIKYCIKRLMVNISKPTSVNKIYNELKSAGIRVGKNTLYELVGHLEDIYLFLHVHKYEWSVVKENSSDKKYYCIDNGLRNSVTAGKTRDKGILLENIVFLWLRSIYNSYQNILYFKGKNECDFVINRGNQVEKLIQVSWDISDKNTLDREIKGLIEASVALTCNDLMIITADSEDEVKESNKTIQVKPAWKVMLQ